MSKERTIGFCLCLLFATNIWQSSKCQYEQCCQV